MTHLFIFYMTVENQRVPVLMNADYNEDTDDWTVIYFYVLDPSQEYTEGPIDSPEGYVKHGAYYSNINNTELVAYFNNDLLDGSHRYIDNTHLFTWYGQYTKGKPYGRFVLQQQCDDMTERHTTFTVNNEGEWNGDYEEILFDKFGYAIYTITGQYRKNIPTGLWMLFDKYDTCLRNEFFDDQGRLHTTATYYVPHSCLVKYNYHHGTLRDVTIKYE